MKGVLTIEGHDIKNVLFDTHNPNSEYGWFDENYTLDGGSISLADLNAWIERFRDYSAKLIIKYFDGDIVKESSVEWKGAFRDSPEQIIYKGELFGQENAEE